MKNNFNKNIGRVKNEEPGTYIGSAKKDEPILAPVVAAVEQPVIAAVKKPLTIEDVDKQVENMRQRKGDAYGITVATLFKELGQKEHVDRIELSADILRTLLSKNITTTSRGKDLDLARVVGEVNLLIYHIKNNSNERLGKVAWWKTFSVDEVPGKSIKLVPVKN